MPPRKCNLKALSVYAKTDFIACNNVNCTSTVGRKYLARLNRQRRKITFTRKVGKLSLVLCRSYYFCQPHSCNYQSCLKKMTEYFDDLPLQRNIYKLDQRAVARIKALTCFCLEYAILLLKINVEFMAIWWPTSDIFAKTFIDRFRCLTDDLHWHLLYAVTNTKYVHIYTWTFVLLIWIITIIVYLNVFS